MANPANFGTLIGRLAQDVRSFDNKDGSKKLSIVVAVDNNFKSGPEKVAQTNFIQLETFVAAGRSMGGWDRVHKGDLIAVNFRVDATPYEKDGEVIYPTRLVVEGFPTFLEPKSVTERRAAERAAKEVQGEDGAAARIAELEAQLAAARGEAKDYESSAPFGG